MILIGTDGGIYRWFEGAGWPVFHSLQGRSVLALASPTPGVLVAVDRSGEVLESENHGLDWRTLPLPAGSGRPTALAADATSAGILLGVKPSGVYQRPVGGVVPKGAAAGGPAWVGTARTLAGGATAMLTARPRRAVPDAETVRRAGWTLLATPGGAPTAELRLIVGLNEAWVAAVSGRGLWRSTDLGKTWGQVDGIPPEVYAVRPVVTKPGEAWAATSDGCRHTADFGQTWTDRSAGLDAVRQVRAVAVNPSDPKNLLVGAAPVPADHGASPRDGLGYGLYESTDGGQKWAKVEKRNFPEGLEFDTINDIRFDPASPENAMVALGSGELWVTRNAGFYWEPVARQIRAARVLCGV